MDDTSFPWRKFRSCKIKPICIHYSSQHTIFVPERKSIVLQNWCDNDFPLLDHGTKPWNETLYKNWASIIFHHWYITSQAIIQPFNHDIIDHKQITFPPLFLEKLRAHKWLTSNKANSSTKHNQTTIILLSIKEIKKSRTNQMMYRHSSQCSKSPINTSNYFMNLACKLLVCKNTSYNWYLEVLKNLVYTVLYVSRVEID